MPDRALRRYERALNHEVDKDLKLLEQIAKEGEEVRKARGLPEVLPPDVLLLLQPKSDENGVGVDAMEGVETTAAVVGKEEEVVVVELGGREERHKEIVKDWERSMAVMAELAKGLPTTAHKLEKAKAAVEFIHEKDKKRKRRSE